MGSISVFASSSWVYPTPSGITAHPDYLVEARIAGSGDAFETIFTYSTKVCKSSTGWNGGSNVINWTYDNTAIAMMDVPDSMEIKITKLSVGAISTVNVRPFSKGISPTITGSVVSFVIPEPMKLSIEINGEMYRNLNLIANPVETNIPSKTDPNVIWFGAGVSNITGSTTTGVLTLNAGQTLYLAPGAFVKGAVTCSNGANVSIKGRGILSSADFADDSWQWTIEAWQCPNFLLEGILVTGGPDNTAVFSDCNGLIVRNYKMISGRHWDDAIHINACKNVLIEDCYTRGSDDNIVFYSGNLVNYDAAKWLGVNQNTINVTVRNCTVWSDCAHPIMIGTHGVFATGGGVFNGMKFENIDILEHRASTWQNGVYQGAMSITANDNNTVKNVVFENIRVERLTTGQLFHIQTNTNTDYSSGPGLLVDSITFRNISWIGTSVGESPSALKCQDASHFVNHITFDNCNRQGNWIKNAISGNLSIDANVKNISYLYPSSEAPAILVNPVSTLIIKGTKAILRVVAAGAATLSYQWYQGESGVNTMQISGAISATYITSAITAATTNFWVKVTNGVSSVNSTTAIVKAIGGAISPSSINQLALIGIDIFVAEKQIITKLSDIQGISTLSIVDARGAVIKTTQTADEQLTTSVPSAGIYLVRLVNDGKVFTQKVIVQ